MNHVITPLVFCQAAMCHVCGVLRLASDAKSVFARCVTPVVTW